MQHLQSRSMQIPSISGFSQVFQERLVLLINHVLAAEAVAQQKLMPHRGSVIELNWVPPEGLPLYHWMPKPLPFRLCVTPAGLFELVTPGKQPAAAVSLHVTIGLPPPHQALDVLRQKRRPDIRVDGDAALAEVISWMAIHLRWDIIHDAQQWFGTSAAAGLSTLKQRIGRHVASWRPPARSSNHSGQG